MSEGVTLATPHSQSLEVDASLFDLQGVTTSGRCFPMLAQFPLYLIVTTEGRMNKAEYKEAFRLASGPAELRDPTALNAGTFDGFGLSDFQPVTCTAAQLASLISWQARQFDGGWDAEKLTEIMVAGRRAFRVIG